MTTDDKMSGPKALTIVLLFIAAEFIGALFALGWVYG